MDWKLEVVVVPVTDIDRAKSFYLDKLGFKLDADTMPTETMRVVHMTPPGSGCSVVIGPVHAETEAELGMRGSLQLVVTDLEAAHSELTERGVSVRDPGWTHGTVGSSCSSPTPTAITGPSRKSASTSARR